MKSKKFTFKQLRIIWPILTKYVKDCYGAPTPYQQLIIKKQWVDFYAKQDFTFDETILMIEDYTSV